MEQDFSVALTIVGLLIIFTIVGLLIWGKISPIVGMTLIPVLGALVLGFGFEDLREFFASGADQVMSVVIMFIFAIIFFGIMQDSGLFNPLVRGMILLTRGNVVIVAVGTAVIGTFAHLDGAGATTFLLTIPALLPLYKELNMSKYLLLLIVSLSAAIMNMVPWGGPMARTASVLDADLNQLWYPLIPLQIVGFILALGLAAFLGMREKKRIAKRVENGEIDQSDGVDVRAVADDFSRRKAEEAAAAEEKPAKHPAMIWVNLALTIAVVALMLFDIAPPEFAFMLGVAIALPINYPRVSDQMGRVRAHAPAALMMAAVILAAGVFLGVMNESGMLDSIALAMVSVLPAAVGPFIHVIVGVLGVPMDLLTSTDAYYFAILPIVESTAAEFGVPASSTAYALMIGNVIGTFVSPFAPAVWLAIGLAGANMGQHIKYSFFWIWGFSIVMLVIAYFIGIFTI
ncbi:CitMHS family citrate-Mg2+:H+ or citrate-Ca2+:H+ symporter [Geomicrobium halophilum]|uniref:CitMHS family citrate-Mg2+:H+ or citrate-Ca2+:H+ symporter n=1 Tax=Geomicrobium halophilum TaxID=549000 RepID=A0A841PWA3_9BACL|nr:citrate:proton symporter [Geomicrobium halophilum]MBB6448222.1 CitMHS family citrate-Mg2+:H+ or citrate-Ca2+:H+ symporter [Geomicrobium halophilum]